MKKWQNIFRAKQGTSIESFRDEQPPEQIEGNLAGREEVPEDFFKSDIESQVFAPDDVLSPEDKQLLGKLYRETTLPEREKLQSNLVPFDIEDVIRQTEQILTTSKTASILPEPVPENEFQQSSTSIFKQNQNFKDAQHDSKPSVQLSTPKVLHPTKPYPQAKQPVQGIRKTDYTSSRRGGLRATVMTSPRKDGYWPQTEDWQKRRRQSVRKPDYDIGRYPSRDRRPPKSTRRNSDDDYDDNTMGMSERANPTRDPRYRGKDRPSKQTPNDSDSSITDIFRKSKKGLRSRRQSVAQSRRITTVYGENRKERSWDDISRKQDYPQDSPLSWERSPPFRYQQTGPQIYKDKQPVPTSERRNPQRSDPRYFQNYGNSPYEPAHYEQNRYEPRIYEASRSSLSPSIESKYQTPHLVTRSAISPTQIDPGRVERLEMSPSESTDYERDSLNRPNFMESSASPCKVCCCNDCCGDCCKQAAAKREQERQWPKLRRELSEGRTGLKTMVEQYEAVSAPVIPKPKPAHGEGPSRVSSWTTMDFPRHYYSSAASLQSKRLFSEAAYSRENRISRWSRQFSWSTSSIRLPRSEEIYGSRSYPRSLLDILHDFCLSVTLRPRGF